MTDKFVEEFFVPISMLTGKVKIQGNIEFAKKLEDKVKNEYLYNYDLYETQDKIKDYIVHKYGIDFYEKSGDAINFIIEDCYCAVERANHP